MPDWDTLFRNVRRSPFADDPNRIPQEVGSQGGNIGAIGWLEDGSVTADVIRANAVVASKIQAGAIETDKLAANAVTAAKIAANTITAAEIASNAITADEIAANTITAAEIAANTITAAEIAADSITTNELAANAVITENVLAANITSSRIELTVSGKNFGANDGTSGAPGLFFDSSSDVGMYYDSGLDRLGIRVSGDNNFLMGPIGSTVGGGIAPEADDTLDLGSPLLRWSTVYRVSESAVSDQRRKRDIEDAPLGLDFVRSLRPRVFRWRDTPDTQSRERVGVDQEAAARDCEPFLKEIHRARKAQLAGKLGDAEAEEMVARARAGLKVARSRHTAPALEAKRKRRAGRRLHYGLIAQEVKDALDAAGVDSVDAAFWQEAPGGEQSLSYSELMIPLLRAVQELAASVDELKNERNEKGQ